MTAQVRKLLAAGAAALAVAAVGVGIVVWRSHRSPGTPGIQAPGQVGASGAAGMAGPVLPASPLGSTVSGVPAPPPVVALRPPAGKPEPAFWIDVLEPARAHRALASNAWVKETAGQPVGRGFLGPWAVFFGTRGQDVGARFEGLVLDLFTGSILGEPYRALWLTGERNGRAPVIVVPEASETALSALGALVAVAGKGGYSPQGCPDDEADQPGAQATPEATDELDEPKDAPPPSPAAGLGTIHRVVLADHALYAAAAGKRLIVSMRPEAVLHGMCLKPFQLARSGNAVEIGVDLDRNGRSVQGLAAMLGLGGEARLALGLEGEAFVPRGIVASVARPGRLRAGALDASMLKLVPATTGTFVTLNLALPDRLDAGTLRAAFSGKAPGEDAVKRQVIVLWNPRGDRHLDVEVAAIWSRAEDEPLLAALLSARHPLAMEKACGHLVLASTGELLRAMKKSCAGNVPSVLSAAPAVVAGLKAPTSLGLQVNLGEVLSQLLLDGWLSEPRPLPPAGAKPERIAPPPEIGEARRQLEALPVMHWKAVVDEKGQLTPGGFRS